MFVQDGGQGGGAVQDEADAVGDFEAAVLAEVLDAVDELARQALAGQFGGDVDVQGDGELAVRGHGPAGDVLGGDGDVLGGEGELLVAEGEGEGAGVLQGGDVLGGHAGDVGGDVLHALADLLAQDAEIRLDALAEEGIVGQEFDFPDVGLSPDDVGHGFHPAAEVFAEDGDEDFL